MANEIIVISKSDLLFLATEFAEAVADQWNPGDAELEDMTSEFVRLVVEAGRD